MSVLGIGVDIINISRIKEIIDRSGSIYLQRVFTPGEQKRAVEHGRPMIYYAKTFAGKEAVFKTFGLGWDTGIEWTDIDISEGRNGEPLVSLSGRLAELSLERGASRVLLSLSYDGDNALAMAMLMA
ncbi:MAG: holo-ACP synthase [Deltaproteobacteria bacterium]|nr:holo-ACP synthase [Deltaproteobacteria bacterium]